MAAEVREAGSRQPASGGSRTGRVRRAIAGISPGERRAVLGMGGLVLALHALGWGALVAAVVPAHYPTGAGQVFGIGLGLTAYTLGLRHAFDADHIAAIDNTTRKLMSEGKRPVTVGFWFSLGHSSVVFGLVFLLALGVRSLVGQVDNGSSTLQQATGVVGTAVSGSFLYLIGILNLVILVGVVKVFRRMRHGDFDEAALEEQLSRRGLVNRILGRATRAVTKSHHMYPVGVLFGLGFDTATEIGLLVLASGAAVFALPWYAVLTLPVLFAAGMSLLDSIDGCFMNFAYGWAFSEPVRKVFYNITVTALSVLVALVIGTIELASIVVDHFGVTSGPLALLGRLDLNDVGYGIVAVFILTWVVALAVWRFGRVEERWSAAVDESGRAG
ncbi:MAG TPA: HoxN/HupN/NixA family nickel/cobalt transporter [Nocardioidaceae bacterium]|nr:HoxN/HupN/NixA family nickel/cobalt transporter [Nocardioidaceae bacterium]